MTKNYGSFVLSAAVLVIVTESVRCDCKKTSISITRTSNKHDKMTATFIFEEIEIPISIESGGNHYSV